MAEGSRIPRGRLRRLGKLVGMTTKVGANLVAGQAKRLLGGEGDPKVAAARRVLETLGELKGVAMKAGQTFSMIADQLPPEVRKVVGRLFSEAPTLPYGDIAKVVEAELGAPPENVFAEFEKEPFAGASLGQVHRARLKTGEEVAVKVQYPGVAEALESDMKNAGTVVRALGMSGALLDTRVYYDELRRELTRELDYRLEIAAVDEFRGYLARWPDLVVPRTFPKLSTSRVLVLERLDGPTLQAYAQDGAPDADRFAVAERLLRAVFGPFLFHRAIHADAHPGNYLVMPAGRMGVLDFGCVKHLSERFWRAHVEALAEGLAGGKPDLYARMVQAGYSITLPEAKARALLDQILHIVARFVTGSYDFASDGAFRELTDLKAKHAFDLMKMRPPPEAVLFYRAAAGVGHDLRALKVRGDLRPFFASALRELGVGARGRRA